MTTFVVSQTLNAPRNRHISGRQNVSANQTIASLNEECVAMFRLRAVTLAAAGASATLDEMEAFTAA
ncbi:hypothetical protein, partial [Nonomuraea guangzhouensis]